MALLRICVWREAYCVFVSEAPMWGNTSNDFFCGFLLD